ncbi:MAG: phage holin family protein [Clostridiales bacterium]|nr:phage holin family protein [Clostridiales bacterium]
MVGALVRFIVSVVVIWLMGIFLPGFHVAGLTGAVLAAAVIALLGWGAEALFGQNISPYARGFVGFLVGAIVIYAAQYIIPSYLTVSFLGALLASLVIGIVDAFVPTQLR